MFFGIVCEVASIACFPERFQGREKYKVFCGLNLKALFLLNLLKGKKIIDGVFEVFYFSNTSAFPFPIKNGGVVDSYQGNEP